jgi:hypothetical protein
MIVTHFIRPNGETYQIVDVKVDQANVKILLVLDNGLSRWFKYNELYIDGTTVFLNTQ